MDANRALQVARENAKKAAANAATDSANQKRQHENNRASLQRQIEGEIRIVLSLLEKAGYPDSVVVTSQRFRQPFLRNQRWKVVDQRAGWSISTYEWVGTGMGNSGDTRIMPNYLLSDGRLVIRGEWLSVPEFVTRYYSASFNSSTDGFTSGVVAGLAKLRQKLEGH